MYAKFANGYKQNIDEQVNNITNIANSNVLLINKNNNKKRMI